LVAQVANHGLKSGVSFDRLERMAAEKKPVEHSHLVPVFKEAPHQNASDVTCATYDEHPPGWLRREITFTQTSCWHTKSMSSLGERHF